MIADVTELLNLKKCKNIELIRVNDSIFLLKFSYNQRNWSLILQGYEDRLVVKLNTNQLYNLPSRLDTNGWANIEGFPVLLNVVQYDLQLHAKYLYRKYKGSNMITYFIIGDCSVEYCYDRKSKKSEVWLEDI